MTECNTKSLQFSGIRRRQIVADFNGGRLTTDAGILLLREVDHRIGLLDGINDCLPDPRDPRYTVHLQREMLAQRIFSLALGYEDLNDHQTLRDDPALQMAAEKPADEESPLASPSTLNRLENRVDRKALLAMTELLVEYIRRRWPQVKITIRGDSGFCRWKLMRWCDKNRVDYVFGLGRNDVLERRIASLMEEAEAGFEATQQKQRLFGETRYAAAKWDRQRRVIMKAERLPEGPNRRFIVTSLSGSPQNLYDDIYVQRGDMENRIKEQQLMLFADRTSCHDFLANQFRLLLSSFAYVLLHELRNSHLQGTDLENAQVNRIRLVLLKVAARVTVSVRRVVLHLSSSYPYRQLFRQVAATLIPSPG